MLKVSQTLSAFLDELLFEDPVVGREEGHLAQERPLRQLGHVDLHGSLDLLAQPHELAVATSH